MDIFDNELYDHLNDTDNQCSVCGTDIDSDKTYCSRNCLEADLL